MILTSSCCGKIGQHQVPRVPIRIKRLPGDLWALLCVCQNRFDFVFVREGDAEWHPADERIGRVGAGEEHRVIETVAIEGYDSFGARRHKVSDLKRKVAT